MSIILAISSLKQRPGNAFQELIDAIPANVSVHYSISTTNLSDVYVVVNGPEFGEYLRENLVVNVNPLVSHTQIGNQTYQTMVFEAVSVKHWKLSGLVTFVILSLIYLDGMLYVTCINRSGHAMFLSLAARVHELGFWMACIVMMMAHYKYDTLRLLIPYIAFWVYLLFMWVFFERAPPGIPIQMPKN